MAVWDGGIGSVGEEESTDINTPLGRSLMQWSELPQVQNIDRGSMLEGKGKDNNFAMKRSLAVKNQDYLNNIHVAENLQQAFYSHCS